MIEARRPPGTAIGASAWLRRNLFGSLLSSVATVLIAALAVLLLSPASGVVTGSVIDWDQQVPGAHD